MGIIRLVQIALVILLVWMGIKAVKRFLAKDADPRRVGRKAAPGEVMDVMVQDPQCGTYLPKQEAFSAWIDGQERFFCSKECRDAFKAGQNKKAGKA
ncbi:MAG: YHS domain-containing protein [Proteobacteria bacterium]|nr:YHS domain-containing protein [Pseudomonadota bacterium]MBU1450021.1 YHS domain-containing protein [Pseudomonadota bacterium]MBU2470629.1 YHS domain-containing protein [Pseudomonadota bacterium]MBU2516642.1 YHS domain-containing protein [Pseudomonadota bacterium]